MVSYQPRESQIQKIDLFESSESARKLLDEPDEPTEWLIDGIWPAGARGFLAGHPGTGKTWLALDLAVSVVTGRSWLETFAVPQPRAVLVIEEETGRKDIKSRLRKLINPKTLTEQEEINLSCLYHLIRKFIKLPDYEQEIIKFINESGVKLMIIDSFRRIHRQNENSSEDMQVPLDSLSRIQNETNCAILLIHHLAKASQEKDAAERTVFQKMRGSGDLWAWRDVLIGMEETEDDLDKANLVFQLREGKSPEPFLVRRDESENGIILARELPEKQENFREMMTRITNAMKPGEADSKTNILSNVKGKKTFKFKVFGWMVNAGQIVKVNEGWYQLKSVPFNLGT